MRPSLRRSTELLARLRSLIRTTEPGMIGLAALVGAGSGCIVSAMSTVAQEMHEQLFGLAPGVRLTASSDVDPRRILLVPLAGGLALGLLLLVGVWRKWRVPVDPIEANALHGGRMSMRDSLVLGLQNILSNGGGASVGLEAGYTQVCAGIASRIGQNLRLRRNDLRSVVACAAAAGIAAAFNAPLAGAFYGFELILGSYSIATLAPVLTSALFSTFTMHWLIGQSALMGVVSTAHVTTLDYFAIGGLGLICGLFGILIMRGVTQVEALWRRLAVPHYLRPALGGLAVGAMGLVSPMVLSSGHGAVQFNLSTTLPVVTLLAVLGLKSLASAISIGSGFRGGMFFASLLLGVVGGTLYASLLSLVSPGTSFDPVTYGVIGMAATAAAIIGGPMTMTFLALEMTSDFQITAGALLAVAIAALTVRLLFGYSFATWRFHLRGETIRSAHDVGWIRTLSVGRLMRRDLRSVPDNTTLDAFRRQFPLGSTQRVIAVDSEDRYAGIVVVSDAHMADAEANPTIAKLLIQRDEMLLPQMNVREAMAEFDRSEADALVVVENREQRKVLGLLTELHALRRYSEELEQRRREMVGEPSTPSLTTPRTASPRQDRQAPPPPEP
jgi:CIC family chloride channel protein